VKQVSTAAELESCLSQRRSLGEVGLVPTMGALHAGHVRLLDEARQRSATVVASIFVNPLQFGPAEDLARYPRDLPHDAQLCAAAGVDVLFAPEPEEMYPQGFCTSVEVHGLGDVLCGASRPGHFRGVATVVLKLLSLVRPTRAYFGQKDYQQTLVVRRMVRDLAVSVAIEVLPTVREADGLAMSSRNAYLTAAQRAQAPVLYRSLCALRDRARAAQRDTSRLREAALEVLREAPQVQLEYLEVLSAATLEPLPSLQEPAVALIAARLGRTRLIDNIELEADGLT
jgi:pantoate--beta-alanine ligase